MTMWKKRGGRWLLPVLVAMGIVATFMFRPGANGEAIGGTTTKTTRMYRGLAHPAPSSPSSLVPIVNATGVPAHRGKLDPRICFFLMIRFDTKNWTDVYRNEAERWLDEVLMASMRGQSRSGTIPVMEPTGFTNPDRKARFEALGGVVGANKISGMITPRCKIVVQSRCDADDYLAPDFVDVVSHMILHEFHAVDQRNTVKKSSQTGMVFPDQNGFMLESVTLSQPQLTRVYMFPKNDSSRLHACVPIKTAAAHSYSPSTGLTAAMTVELFQKKKFNILIGEHTNVVSNLQADRALFLPHAIVMSPVTSLSGHFPWLDTTAWPACDLEEFETYFGKYATHLMTTVNMPNISWLDGCYSNTFLKGILTRASGSPQNMSCEQLDTRFTELKASDKKDFNFPFMGPWTPRLLDGKIVSEATLQKAQKAQKQLEKSQEELEKAAS